MGMLLLAICVCSLSGEVETFMEEYLFNGYSLQWSRGIYLTVDEPKTFLIYPGSDLEGVLCGAGGNAILDLRLELQGGGLNIIDDEPDDLPVLPFTSGSGSVAYSVTVTALDMLYGATADSAYVFFAMRPVIAEVENSVPVVLEPDSAIMGE